ncbi:AIPR family protein [Micromonospora chersina]|uniref:AIPR family protein n=1 Tax=Micromonospora chersina TaxID=47854 RepID=UPI003713A232
MASSSTQDIINHHFDVFRQRHFPKMTQGDAFTQFCVRLALKRFKLNEASMGGSVVDGKYDGGIDSFHIILNETEAVTSDMRGLSSPNPPKGLQAGVPFDVVLVQAKSDSKWDHQALWKLRENVVRLLNPDVSLQELRETPLNEMVVSQVNAYRRIEKKLLGLNPARSFHVYLMTSAGEGGVHKHLQNTQKDFERALREALPHGTDAKVRLIGAEGFYDLIRQEADFEGLLKFSKPPTRESRGSTQSFLGLVTVKQYLEFLRRKKTSVLRDEFFTANVRDFAGPRNAVNSAIRNTLAEDSKTAFWWMNNGITILADGASEPANDSWLLKNPQIVNGLQTSHVLHEADLEKLITRKRMQDTILIRVITEKDRDIRESIITGTNNQTSVSAIQLYANDEVQRHLETYLLSKGWYYERRRWQYRNADVPASRIRNISELAQAVIAIHMLRPDAARARPRDLLSTRAGYDRIFSAKAPDQLYSKALDLMDSIDEYLRTSPAQEVSRDVTNDRYYLASGYIVRSLGLRDLGSYSGWASVGNIDPQPKGGLLEDLHKLLYEQVGEVPDVRAKDRLFKGRDLKESFFRALIEGQ